MNMTVSLENCIHGVRLGRIYFFCISNLSKRALFCSDHSIISHKNNFPWQGDDENIVTYFFFDILKSMGKKMGSDWVRGRQSHQSHRSRRFSSSPLYLSSQLPSQEVATAATAELNFCGDCSCCKRRSGWQQQAKGYFFFFNRNGLEQRPKVQSYWL